MQNYEIYIDNGNGEKLFYRAGISELNLSNIKYKPVAGSAGSLEFTVPFTHPSFKEIEPLNTDFWLYKNKKKIFRGRYIGNQEDFYRNGQITCEGDLNFLVDSLQDPYEFEGGITDFIKALIKSHNSRVEARKQFTVGQVQVTDTNDYLRRSNSNYSTTADALKNKLVGSYGGYFRTRYANGKTYLDYLYNMGQSSQVIRFGENLIDVKKVVDPSTIITCLVPLGAEIEDETGTSEAEGAAKRVDISSVNDGKKYIENAAGIKKWGRIWGTQNWDNVTIPKNLLSKAKKYLADQISLPATITLTAVDLSLIDASVDDFGIGEYIKVESNFHELKASDGGYILTQAEIDISNPANSTITLGGNLTSIAMKTSRSLKDIDVEIEDVKTSASSEIRRRVKATSELITGGRGGYVKFNFDDDGHPDEILIMDTDNIKTAKHVIRMNVNGIGFSKSGYDPKTFDTAWGIDGTFYANYITAGTMLADRVRGGTLVAGGIGNGETGTIRVVGSDNKTTKVLMNENGIDIRDGRIRLAGGTWDSSGLTLPKGTTISGDNITAGTIKGSTLVAGGANNANGLILVQDASNDNRIIMSKDGMYINGALDATNGHMYFYGDVFRVYKDGSNSGCYSSIVNTSHRVWKDAAQSDVYSYIGQGGDYACYGEGSSDSGIVLLTGDNAKIHMNGDKAKIQMDGSAADIVINGHSLVKAMGWDK